MRITAGSHRGRTLRVPRAKALRPSSDRLRQAVFNILGHGGSAFAAYAGEPIIDIFAGTGAYGFEALSRGAAFATFIDSDREAVFGIRSNAALLGETAAVAALRLDAACLMAPRQAGTPAVLAFLDPPYGSGLSVAALQGLRAHGWLRMGATAVVEVAAQECFSPPAGYELVDERTYGAGRAVFTRLVD